jgi:1,2-diacylglycerol-3-alpha-glucose alpha-1,2-glucosyltransferase
MRILLFRDDERVFAKSGVGRAMKHQEIALKLAGVDFTTDSDADFDIIHLNTINPQSYLLAKKARRDGKKVVFHAHSTEEDFKNSFAFSNVMAPAFKKMVAPVL